MFPSQGRQKHPVCCLYSRTPSETPASLGRVPRDLNRAHGGATSAPAGQPCAHAPTRLTHTDTAHAQTQHTHRHGSHRHSSRTDTAHTQTAHTQTRFTHQHGSHTQTAHTQTRFTHRHGLHSHGSRTDMIMMTLKASDHDSVAVV